MFDPAAIAQELRTAEQTAQPIQLLTERFADLTWEQARSVARARDGMRLEDGEQLIGWKLGWTSGAMRKALGIDRPNWGTLWASQMQTRPLSIGALIHPKVEPELVYRVPAEGEPGQWALGLEIVDPRFPSFTFDWLDNTADNSSSARVVVGPFAALDGDPADMHITFGDGDIERMGRASDAMGSPATAVAWLIEALAAEDLALQPGQIVFTGGLAAPFDVTSGVTYDVGSHDASLASVTLSVVD